ncbi:serine hydrolase domain-containing protein [Pontixanthobacter aestiaquae]|uniref:Serine hydrolase n=1 Tax=Pontixanthobacter aestiaquae TaxID=1509367 RepID=A0A844Z5M7_9SPHN|nr:serine hydrolase domain-containing protein [Pontixanthobacter aestiaquae]MDN3646628.1 serine hydrolase domain-containing protein [Pontixanthobacter aestiaquae]MXO82387.1 serine hydrolase [Pontixanthobacter aestiaquae]
MGQIFRFFFGAVVIGFLGACVSVGQNVGPSENAMPVTRENARLASWLGARFEQLAEDENIPGMSIGVVRNGANSAVVNLGYHNRSAQQPTGSNSIYQIASLSKTLTGAMVNSLIARGRIDPQASVGSYLSPLVDAEAKVQLDMITVENLLQHTAGISETDCSVYRERQEGEAWSQGYTRGQLVTDLDALEINPERIGKFAYSSCGYAVLGLVAEVAANKGFAALIDEYITDAYGMKDTAISLSASQLKRLTTPYRKDDRAIATAVSDMGMATPGSAIYSTIDDLMIFQLAQMRAYRAAASGGKPSPLVLTRRMADVPGEPVKFGYGLIQLSHPKGIFYLHDGDADGFASVYVFSPEHDLGLTILTTSGGKWLNDAAIETMVEMIDRTYLSEGVRD